MALKYSIQKKWLLFISILLWINMIVLAFFMLRGIQQSQNQVNESNLLEMSKTANLYMREQYISSTYKSFEIFFKNESENLAEDISRITQSPVIIYNQRGEALSTYEGGQSRKAPTYLKKALENQIVYEKQKNQMVYLAPLYDFEGQIGVIEFIYNIESDIVFYQSVKTLFYRVGGISIVITILVGWLYFSQVAKKILKLKQAVESIEGGHYEAVSQTQTFDELDDLQNGIFSMSQRMQQTLYAIQKEKEKLEQAVAKLEKLEKQQKTFIGNITHEFKTPLTVIKAQIDLMHLFSDDKVRAEKSKLIADQEILRLGDMIERILDLSRVEKYDFETKQEPFNTKALLQDICHRMTGKASKYHIKMIENIEDAWIMADRESFMQIFINLIDNAIKYNHTGGEVLISSHVSNGTLQIEVADTGIGIPKEHHSQIFEPFYTVDQNRSKIYSGTGLGLSLVLNLLEKNHGFITVIEKDIGTCFRVEFKIINGMI